jgi:DNA-binding SARP family transcriptional activator
VWWGTPPRSARTTLQTCLLQLRELIGTAPAQREREGEGVVVKDILATVPGGYRLQTRDGTVDHREFERRAGTGCRTMDARDRAGAGRRSPVGRPPAGSRPTRS